METAIMTIDQLMDVLQSSTSSATDVAAVRAEIRQRAESPFAAEPDLTTPDAILMRAVAQLKQAGRCDVAHACLVLFAGVVPDAALLNTHALPPYFTAQPGHPGPHHGQGIARDRAPSLAVDERDACWLASCLV
jgi:hypothetical protein